MTAVLPFRTRHPVAVVSIPGANWSVQLFGARACEPVETLEFAVAASVAFCASSLRRDGWRVIYRDGARGIREQVEGASL